MMRRVTDPLVWSAIVIALWGIALELIAWSN